MDSRPRDKKDICRNSFYTGVIRNYIDFLSEKHEFLGKAADFFEGNYSLSPYYRSHKSQTPL